MFILLSGYIIIKKGGTSYIKRKIFIPSQDHSISYLTKKSILEVMPNDSSEIIFLGSLLIDNCDWHEFFRNPNIKNRGISGDNINGVIERLDEVLGSFPKKVFVMLGSNDLNQNYSVGEILNNYEKLVKLIIEKSPDTKTYVQSVLPTYHDFTRDNDDIISLNAGLEKLAQNYNLNYIDLFNVFKTDTNERTLITLLMGYI